MHCNVPMILFKHVYDDVDFAEGLNDFIHLKKVMMCTSFC